MEPIKAARCICANAAQDAFDLWLARLEDLDEVCRPRVAKPSVRQQKIAPLNTILVRHNVSWI